MVILPSPSLDATVRLRMLDKPLALMVDVFERPQGFQREMAEHPVSSAETSDADAGADFTPEAPAAGPVPGVAPEVCPARKPCLNACSFARRLSYILTRAQ